MPRDDFEDLLEAIAREAAQGSLRALDGPDDDASMLESLEARSFSSTPIAQAAIDLLVASEISSRAHYDAALVRPMWPGNRSGVTIGIGYDVGTVSPAVLAQDWAGEMDTASIGLLAQACGVLGPDAARLVPGLRSIVVPFDQANRVFMQRSVPLYVAETERALPNASSLGPECLGALVSLSFNRGADKFTKPGERFSEMRAIRDHMQDRQFGRIPGELRSMKRIWIKEPNSRGLVLRREAEALLFERGLAGSENVMVSTASEGVTAPNVAAFAKAGQLEGPPAAALEGVFSTITGWLRPIVEEPTRHQLMFQLAGGPEGDAALVRRDEDYVAFRLLSAQVVNARRWTSLYHGAVHADCSMLYEGIGRTRVERQSVLAPDGFRDIDPKGQGKLLQVDRPLFGPMPYRGDLQFSVALFSVKSSDLAGPYLSLISALSQTASLGFLTAAMPFVAPLKQASDLLFGTSDASSLECGTVRGFKTLRAGRWVCLGATRDDVGDPAGFRLNPEDFGLLDADGVSVQAYPYLVFEITRVAERDDWMEIPSLRTAWEAIIVALGEGKDEEVRTAAQTFRRACFAGGDLTISDAQRLAEKADRKVTLTLGPAAASPRLETVAPTLRSLDLYDRTANHVL